MLDIKEIQKIIPHRPPFLLIDHILELEPGKRALGLKNVSINEPYFTGHFPDYPVMPGVLIIEAMAQVGAVALLSLEENKGKLALFAGIDKVRFKRQVAPGLEENKGKLALFAGIDKVRFKRQVAPGEQLKIEVVMTKMRSSIGRGEGKAYIGDELAVSGELLFGLAEG